MSKDHSPQLQEVALIAGPTASGKSDLAVRLALRLREAGREAAVINADSAQVYRDLAVLSARPTAVEMCGIEHRLFGAWDGAEACSAADWAAQARQEIEQARQAGIVPILVGGSGLYLRTLIEGIAPIPPIDPAVRREVRALPVAAAYAALQREDPQRAAMLAPGDSARTARALEVVRSTGAGMLDWQRQSSGGIGNRIALAPLVLLPEREALYERCDARFAAMIERGAVEEVEALLARGLSSSLPVMRAIGVREIAGWLRGEYSRDEAGARGGQATRNYAKRQYTWFRNQPPEDWPRTDNTNITPDRYFETLFHNKGLT